MAILAALFTRKSANLAVTARLLASVVTASVYDVTTTGIFHLLACKLD
jgi:hypothetical protein